MRRPSVPCNKEYNTYGTRTTLFAPDRFFSSATSIFAASETHLVFVLTLSRSALLNNARGIKIRIRRALLGHIRGAVKTGNNLRYFWPKGGRGMVFWLVLIYFLSGCLSSVWPEGGINNPDEQSTRTYHLQKRWQLKAHSNQDMACLVWLPRLPGMNRPIERSCTYLGKKRSQ